MRVTGNMLSSNLLGNLYNNLKYLNKYQNQISDNKRILRLSDDPIGAVNCVQIENDIKKTEQMAKNISDAQSWLTQTETALSEMNGMLVRAKELAIDAGNGTYTEEQRQAVREELLQLRDLFLETANTKFTGKYIFGGHNTVTKPFSVNGGVLSYNSIEDLSSATPSEINAEGAQSRQYRVGPQSVFDVSLNGLQVVGSGEDNLYNLFEGFIGCIDSPDLTPEIASYSEKFSAAQGKILTLIADVGGRQSGLEIMADRYESEDLNLNALYTKIAGIDPAETITQYKMAETTYNAALAVGAQIIQRSLVDFLR